ncbi:AAA family ATPase [Mycobacterium sp. DBP42]|uniref:AAA family ATPase n=1 Tax=Mycobacterium sp. DBP42 TaxID=2545267 RepID=UPI00110CCF7A|nr:AAA family ATPase [Mycobacterium sp. DBP42]TMS54803.1 EVE domain-containing protein [Mycobacterium sp. DBP42]
MAPIDDLGTKAYSGMGREGTPFIETLGPKIINNGLLQGRSTMSHTEQAWTEAAAAELIAVYVESPDTSGESFDNKLRKQVSTTSRAARLLFSDLILLNLLPLGDYGAVRKRELVCLPIEDLDPPATIPADVEAALHHGMFKGGIGFKSGRFARLRWLITFAHYACGVSKEERTAALADPLSFREFVQAAPGASEGAQRQSLLYLAFPWFYLPTIIARQRTRIRDAFADQCLQGGKTDDVDIDLHKIYANLTQAAGGPIDFYRDPVYEQRWAEPAPPKRQVWILQPAADEFDLTDYLKKPDVGAGTPGNLRLRQHVKEVAEGDTVLLWSPTPQPGIYATGSITGDNMTEHEAEAEPDGQSTAGRSIGFELKESLLAHPLTLDRMAAEPVLKDLEIVKNPTAANFKVTGPQWEMLRTLLERPTPVPGPRDHGWLINEIHWPPGEIDDLTETLRTRRPQVILAGPPGTGKTYVAEKVAEHLTGGLPGTVQIIQFHPSYAYEDFVEGLRPVAKDGQVTFEVIEGKLVRLADAARNSPDQSFVLVIDEINRANLPSVFGELLYLLEYREKEIQLLLREKFSLPRNLYIIGTMNTADRSVRNLDAALRRRFDIFDCPPRDTVLERYYDRGGYDSQVLSLLDGFKELNARLREDIDENHTIGHSYFMRRTYTPDDLRRTWLRQILPLLREYYFDQPSLVDQFVFNDLWPDQPPL